MDTHELIDSTGKFNVQRWRQVTSSVGADIAPGISVLCPFGFEFMGDESYLYKSLKRFYIYIGVPESSNLDKEKLGAEYCSKLLELLKKDYPQFYKSLGCVVNPLARSSLNSDGSRLLYIAKPVTTDSILNYYTGYLLSIPHGVVNHQLREYVDFDHSIPSRRYLFQRVIVLASLFPDCAPGESDLKSIFQFIRDHSRRPISVERVNEERTPEERRLLDEVIEPMMEKITKVLVEPSSSTSEDEITTYDCYDIHSQKALRAMARPSQFETRQKNIIKAYRNYGK